MHRLTMGDATVSQIGEIEPPWAVRVEGRDMNVATWRGESHFTIDEAPDPAAGPGQVVVSVHTAGICGTDIHATQGLFPWSPPLVMGHEYSGVVREVGRGVSKRLLGCAVACEPSFGCGECSACEAGRISQCPKASRIGGFAERVALPRLSSPGPRSWAWGQSPSPPWTSARPSAGPGGGRRRHTHC